VTEDHASFQTGAKVIVADANVLYSRVLRDYVLVAAEHDILRVHWSQQILNDMVDHLIANRPKFDTAAAQRLTAAMGSTFPDALVVPQPEDFSRLKSYNLPDEDDGDVIATALAAEAGIICTSNLRDFPKPVMDELGLIAIRPDTLLSSLIRQHLPEMISVHRTVVTHLHGATDESTVSALRKAGANETADRITKALMLSG